MEKEVRAVKNAMRTLKDKMKEDRKKEKEIHRKQLQNTKVRFPTHTTNVYHSICKQPSAALMSSDSLSKFTSL